MSFLVFVCGYTFLSSSLAAAALVVMRTATIVATIAESIEFGFSDVYNFQIEFYEQARMILDDVCIIVYYVIRNSISKNLAFLSLIIFMICPLQAPCLMYFTKSHCSLFILARFCSSFYDTNFCPLPFHNLSYSCYYCYCSHMNYCTCYYCCLCYESYYDDLSFSPTNFGFFTTHI